ncbi:hypothetical protein BFG60_3049 [Microcystis aeruginosa NIES-98]|nr:hypothetical protein BFG60_3049 [Microcystis aeruginosa NIES-98]
MEQVFNVLDDNPNLFQSLVGFKINWNNVVGLTDLAISSTCFNP